MKNRIMRALQILPAIALFFSQSNLLVQASETPTNFLLILADDLGYGDLSIQGSQQIQTPHIDSIAENGVRFSQAYVTSAVCAPSRAGLLTGIHPVSFGFRDNLTPVQRGHDPEFVGLPIEQKTLADHFKKRGYTSGVIGKWHLGELPQFHPLQRGFDEFWGYLGGGHDYFDASESGNGMKCQLQSNKKTLVPLSYLTNDQGDECVDFIRRHKDRPFFLYASFAAPHSPMQAPEADLNKFSHIKDKTRRTYCAMVHRLDINVGKILTELRQQGLEERTCVVFLSDNGGSSAPVIRNGSCNAPLRGSKTTLWEGGIRVPLFMKYPRKIAKGLVKDSVISSMDIAPTFLQMTDPEAVTQPKFDGKSLLPLILNGMPQDHHATLFWNYTVGFAIRDGDWKLMQLPDCLPRLFDLQADRSEQHDVAKDQPEKVEQLLKKLGNWQLKSPDPLFREPANWRLRHRSFYDVPYSLEQPSP
jgi:arylsulfatase A-like enzyme